MTTLNEYHRRTNTEKMAQVAYWLLLGIGQNNFTGGPGPEAFTNGFHYGIAFVLVLAVIGFVISLRLKARPAPAPEGAPDVPDKIVPLGSLMNTDVYTVREDMTLTDALALIVGKGVSGVPVVDEDGNAVAFISDGDIIRFLTRSDAGFVNVMSFVAPYGTPEGFTEKLDSLMNMKVRDIDPPRIISVDIDTSVEDVCHILNDRGLRKIPVMKDGRMVGIINRSNIIGYAVKEYGRRMEA